MNDIGRLIAGLKRAVLEEKHDPSIKDFLQAHVHEAFTVAADKLAQMGYLTVDERIALSSAVGDMLEAFRTAAAEKCPVSAKTTLSSDVIQKLMEK